MSPFSSRLAMAPVPAAAPLILAAACWGSGTVLSKQAVAAVPPVLLLGIQLAVSLLFLSLAARIRGESIGLLTEPRRLGALGLLNPGLAYALGLVALTHISASVAVVIWATEPALVALLATVVLGERLGRAAIVLTAVAIGGILVLAGDMGPGTTGLGVALMAVAVLCCAIYTVATRRWLPDTRETLSVVIGQQVAALGLALGLVVVTGATIGWGQAGNGVLDAAAIASVVASGLVYYGIAYWFYLAGLRRVSASLAATSFYLIPVFGLVVAFAFGERLEPRASVGALIVLAAVAGIGWFARHPEAG